MKIASIIGIICALLIGIAIGYTFANSKKPAKEIALRFNPATDLIVTAKKGDTLKWYNYQGRATGVTFDSPSACEASSDPKSGTCTLTGSGIYKYKCNDSGCEDPAVGGGDDTLADIFRDTSTHLDPPYATPKTVYPSCAASGPYASPIVGAVGSAFFVQFNDATSSATFPPGTCQSGTSAIPNILNSKNSTCRIIAAANNVPYKYNFNVTGCRGSGTSTITVTPPPQ